MIEHIYVVLGSGNSDIGKGWLTATIASLLPRALPVKIDPLLNNQFPADLGIHLGKGKRKKIVSEDFETYREMGLPVFPESNILNGALLLEFLQKPLKVLSRGDSKKLTFADLSELLAKKLFGLTNLVDECRNLVIEVGGIVTDREHIWIPNALKLLGIKANLTPEIVILSYIEYSEVGFPIKTQNVRMAIRDTQSRYGLPIKACFVRRRHVPNFITEAQIRKELLNIAFETQLSPDKVIFEENVADVFKLRTIVETTGLFGPQKEQTLVSSCLLGVPCRYDGTSRKLPKEVLKELLSREVVTVCPELLAGLGVPRTACEIVGGNGHDVLDGKAKVLSKSGQDMTEYFVVGAQKTLEIVQRFLPSRIILCDKSPSCGGAHIFDGTFSGKLKHGRGILPALLERSRFRYVTNTELSTKAGLIEKEEEA